VVLDSQVRPVLQGVVDHHPLPDPADARAKGPRGNPQPHPETEGIQAQLLTRMPGPGSSLPEFAPHLGVPGGIQSLRRRRGPEGPGLRKSIRAHPGKILPGRTQSNGSHRRRGRSSSPAKGISLGLTGDLHATPSAPKPHLERSGGLGEVQGGEVFAVDVCGGQIPPSQRRARSRGRESVRPEPGKIQSLQTQGPGPSRPRLHTGGLRRQRGIGFQRIAFARPGGIGSAAADDRRRRERPVEGAVQADQRGDR